jgi:hypothetical protein
MEKSRMKKVALLLLPITIFLVLISVSYAINIPATIKVLFGGLNVKIIHPENITYYTSYDTFTRTLVARFKVDNTWGLIAYRSKYIMNYSLDDEPFIPIGNNVFYLTNLSLGGHKLVVIAKDQFGNSGSDVVYFSIVKKSCLELFYMRLCI